jgi:hypothetical protein
LTEPLVDTTADATKGDNINATRLIIANPLNSLAEVGTFLIVVMDDRGWNGLRGVEVADGGMKGIQVANDGLEVRLCGDIESVLHRRVI